MKSIFTTLFLFAIIISANCQTTNDYGGPFVGVKRGFNVYGYSTLKVNEKAYFKRRMFETSYCSPAITINKRREAII